MPSPLVCRGGITVFHRRSKCNQAQLGRWCWFLKIYIYIQPCFFMPMLCLFLPLPLRWRYQWVPYRILYSPASWNSCALLSWSWQSKGTCPGAIPEYPSPSLWQLSFHSHPTPPHPLKQTNKTKALHLETGVLLIIMHIIFTLMGLARGVLEPSPPTYQTSS